MLYFEQGKLDLYYLPTHISAARLASRVPTLLIAHPVHDPASEQLIAVLAGWADLEDLRDVINEMGGLEETGETYLVNSQHRIVATSQASEMQGRAARSSGIEAALSGQSGWDTYRSYTGARVIGAYRWLPRLGLALVIEQEESVAVQAATQLVFRNVAVAIVALLVATGLGVVQSRLIVQPLTHLTEVVTDISEGNLAREVEVDRRDEIGVLARAFARMTARLRDLIGDLERRVSERTGTLAHRSVQLQTAAQVSEVVSSILNPATLEQQVVELIAQRLGYYYVGLFLVDGSGEQTGEPGRWAVLRAGSSEAGRQMLEAGHKLEISGASMVGSCIADSRPRIALDVGEEPIRFDNPLLPETRSEMALPLLARGQVIGAITVQSEREAAFGQEDVSILQTMATQVANSIQNTRLFEQTQQRSVQLRTAAEVSRVASSILDIDQLLTTSVNLIRDRFDLYYVGLFLVDESGEFAVLRAGTGEAGRQMLAEGHKLALGGESMVGWCVVNAQARIALDASEDTVRSDNPLLPKTRSEMALPLVSQSQVIGAMTIQSAQEAAFSESDISVLQIMADQVANAIANARSFRQLERRNRELAALYAVASTLSQSQSLDEVLASALSQVLETLALDAGLVSLADPQSKELVLSVQQGLPDVLRRRLERDGLEGTLCALVFEGKAELGVGDLAERAPVDVSGLLTQGLRSYLGAPIVSKGEVLGTLCVFGWDPRPMTDADFELMRAIGEQLGLVIENIRLFRETQANLEEISRLHRRYLQEQWEQFLADEETRQRAGYLFDQRNLQPAGDLWRPEIELAVTSGQTLALTADSKEWPDGDGDARAALVVPLQLRGQTIGALDFFETAQDREWSEDEIALVEAVATQVVLALENARAYETLQKTATQLREMDKLKSQFLANMSHELRTPLNSIIGFSRVLLKGIDGPITDLQRTDLASIYNSGQHLLGLINDILDMVRIEAGRMELVFEPVDLNPIIDGVMSTAIGLTKDKPVELVKEVADDLPIIRADSMRIRQVILNLFSNAAKFTEEGSITVRAWADGDHVCVSVADTGIGIPEDDWEKVFKEFEQVDGSATRRVHGTGLGLPISRHFVEMHGGHIWMDSRPGAGSTFTFTIPIHGPGYVEDPKLAALEIDPDRRLVLAIEAGEEMWDFYRRHLEKHGYQVVSLTDGSRASLWVRELLPFTVLLDVMLPDTDGWAVLEKLKISRETAPVPVIVCGVAGEEARGLSLGAAAYLTKPVLEEDLLQAMDLVAKLQAI